MPINKNALIRYQTLDKCFSNRQKKYFMDDLVEACNIALKEFNGGQSGVKKRQINYDIIYMESEQGYNIPLERSRDGKKVYYRYERKDFSINNNLLNKKEEAQLKEALTVMSRFKGMPQFEWVDEMILKLEEGMGLSDNSSKLIEFQHNQNLKGLEYITPIYSAIFNKECLKIKYKNFKTNEIKKLFISPYFLKQYNNRWFAFGLSQEYDNITNLALDRIESLVPTDEVFIENKSIDFDEYFEDVIGVTVNSKNTKENVEIKVDSGLFPYLETKPIHKSQTSKKTDNGGIIELRVIPNYELESLILSFGGKVEVLKPEALRLSIKEKIKKLHEVYY